MERLEVKMLSLIVMLALVKTAPASDLPSDITSTVDDQYRWSALAQRKGPTVQEPLEWKRTATDRSEKFGIDRFLGPGWKESPDKHYSGSSSGLYLETSFGIEFGMTWRDGQIRDTGYYWILGF